MQKPFERIARQFFRSARFSASCLSRFQYSGGRKFTADFVFSAEQTAGRRGRRPLRDLPHISASAMSSSSFGCNDGLSYSDWRSPLNAPSRESGRDRMRVRMRACRTRRSHARLNVRVFANEIAGSERGPGREESFLLSPRRSLVTFDRSKVTYNYQFVLRSETFLIRHLRCVN